MRQNAWEFDGGALKAARKAAGMTQTEVADGLKALNRRMFGRTTAGNVSGWERGATPSANIPPNLAIVLGCSESKLYRKATA